MGKFIDISGQVFGEIVVLADSGVRGANGDALALARLECGASLMEVCEEFGINKSYAYKIKQRKTTNGVGTYLSDLTLEKALGEFYANR